MSNKVKDVFTVINKEKDGKAFWVKIGTAFENKDCSLSVALNALPTNGRLVIRNRRFNSPSVDA